ncbi:hypothetical protein Ahy_A10g051039 isoform C [Arachis hypogaea]|uniref:Uncharacterized protein n=1 Tax=Arachis hypogaea TaxID=3818 RepID=A0A445BBB2_ARAHY|nr:hypothetical protein Ahy_A10g051039 isoform C [Arachis hypogaea]
MAVDTVDQVVVTPEVVLSGPPLFAKTKALASRRRSLVLLSASPPTAAPARATAEAAAEAVAPLTAKRSA